MTTDALTIARRLLEQDNTLLLARAVVEQAEECVALRKSVDDLDALLSTERAQLVANIRATAIGDIERAEKERDEARQDARLNGEIISKVNDAVNRAGIHCAVYYWEAIDMVASERDSLRSECERLRAELAERDTVANLVATVERLKAELAEARRRILPDEERLKLEGDIATAERDTAEAIAAWLDKQYSPFTSMNGRDRDYLNGVIENIRSGAWRPTR